MKKSFITIFLAFLFISTSLFAQIVSTGSSGNWSATTTWVGGVVPSATDSVVISDGAKVTIDGNVTVTNIRVGSGVSGILQFSKTAVCTLTVTGNIVAFPGSIIRPQSSGTGLGSIVQTAVLYGDLSFFGSSFNLRSGSASGIPPTIGVLNFVFAGSANTTISGNFSMNTNAFNSITINKTDGAKVILNNTIYVLSGSVLDPASNSIVNFVSGLIETGDNTLVLQSNRDSVFAGASPSSYVLGNYGTALSLATKIFPVGDANGYRPITIRSTDTSGSSTAQGYHYVTASCIPGNADIGPSVLLGGIDKVSAVRYYSITYYQGTTAKTSLSFNLFSPSYGSDDGVTSGNSNLMVAYSTDARATWNGITQTKTHTTVVSDIPTTITPDSLQTSLVLNNAQSLFVALARVAGSTENSLGTPQGIVKESGMPKSFELSQNYPNPFNPSTSISFSIAQSSVVRLRVYNVTGQEVADLLNERKDAGIYKISFDGSKLSSGVYFYRLSTGNMDICKKMLMIK